MPTFLKTKILLFRFWVKLSTKKKVKDVIDIQLSANVLHPLKRPTIMYNNVHTPHGKKENSHPYDKYFPLCSKLKFN